jgi:endo-1,4-beta-D-glucanase Y
MPGTYTSVTPVGGSSFVGLGGSQGVLGGASTITSGTGVVGGATAAVGGAKTTGGSGGKASGGTGGTGGAKTTGGSGGKASGGTSATGGAPLGGAGNCPAVAAGVLSDFESGKGSLYPQSQITTGTVNGYWFSFKDSTKCASATQVPAEVKDAAVNAEALPTSDSRYSSCNRYAMHSSISGCSTYSGFGAALSPTAGSTVRKAVDASGYDGVSFWIKAGSGTQGPIYVEFQTKECVPADSGGTAVSQATDMYQCYGKLISTVPTTWTQVFVPFGTLGPRSIPAPGTDTTTTCQSSTFCEPPKFVASNLLAVQFALEDPFNQIPAKVGTYDVWVDDVALYKGDNGLAAAPAGGGANPFPADKAYANPTCAKPTGAKGKFIQDAYANWKAKYVTGTGRSTRVVSPEIDNGATVSEGVAYGMLIAVYMNDKTLFDGLWGYWQDNKTAGTLMTWKIPGGSGSATDADEDAAFALLMAAKQWPTGDYATAASTMIKDIWNSDIDATTKLPKGGSNYTSPNPTNPSYFAPAYYKEFAKVDSGHDWDGVVTACYNALNSGIGSAVTSGLVPAWCASNCTTVGTNGADTDGMYQYDSHRVPWRVGVDACWNSEPKATTYLNKVVKFFADASATAGLSSLYDVYTTTGGKGTGAANNSMSIIGCAGVGAMAVGSASLRDRAYQFLLEGAYTANPTFKTGATSSGSTVKVGYSYYNATVGMLMLLTMTGNFYVM